LGFAQLPAAIGVPEIEWHRALDDGGRFLDAFGSHAAALGWTPGEIFDVRSGVIWRLAGEPVRRLGSKRRG
jgi:hypothetical protein